jgi:hypothetical protein
MQTPKVCDNITGTEGEQVQWTNPSTNCIVSKDGTNTFPFTPASPINISPPPPQPAPNVFIAVPKGTYTFQISCCLQNSVIKTVNVGDGTEAKHRK